MAFLAILLSSIFISITAIFLTNNNLDPRSKAYTPFVSSNINQSFDNPLEPTSSSTPSIIASDSANTNDNCGDTRGHISGTYCANGSRYVVDIPSTREAATKFAKNNDNITYDPYSGKITFLDSQSPPDPQIDIPPTTTPSATIIQLPNVTDTNSSATIDNSSVFIKIETPQPIATMTPPPSPTRALQKLSLWEYLLKLIGLN